MLVISAKSGQLGNRLLLFANFIAFASDRNLRVLNPAFEEYAEFFQFTSKDLFCSYPVPLVTIKGNKALRKRYYSFIQYLYKKRYFNNVEITRDKPFNWSDSKIVDKIDLKGINLFNGWLFRDGWFVADTDRLRKHADNIRHYFTPLEEYQANVSKLMLEVHDRADVVIGVHIRHGDYQQHQGGKYFYTLPEYLKVMKSIEKLFPEKKVSFLICSNAKHDRQLFKDFNYTFGNNSIIEDMYSLAQCDYIIGPPSSYTMWASFYGDKPLYMIRDTNRFPEIKNFVHFYEWQGIFHDSDDWSKSYWEWTH